MKTNKVKKKVGARRKHAPTKERPPNNKKCSLSRLGDELQKARLKVKSQKSAENCEVNKVRLGILEILTRVVELYKLQIEATTVEEVARRSKEREQLQSNEETERTHTVEKIDAWLERSRLDDEWYKHRFEKRSLSQDWHRN